MKWLRDLLSGKSKPPARVDYDKEPIILVGQSLPLTVEMLLTRPFEIDYFDRKVMRFCREHVAALEPGLLGAAQSASIDERLHLGKVLLRAGAARGGPLVLAALASTDAQDQRNALVALSMLDWRADEGLLVPIDQMATAGAIQPFLAHEDDHDRGMAVQTFLRLDDPRLADAQRALLRSDDKVTRTKAAVNFASYKGDAEAWPILRALIEGDPQSHDRYFMLHALDGFALSDDPALRADVATFARGLLERLKDTSDNDAANEAFGLLSVIGKLAPPWERELLEQALSWRLEGWARGAAFQRLADLEGEAAAPRILAALDNEKLRGEALTAIRSLGAKLNDPRLAPRLHALLKQDRINIDAITDALLALGETIDVDQIKTSTILDPWRRFEIAALAKQLSADDMIARLDAVGLLPLKPDDALATFRAEWPSATRVGALMSLMEAGGRYLGFDSENDRVPPNYPDLVGDLCAMAHGAFSAHPDIFLYQQGDRYIVEATIAERPARFYVTEQGDWFDVPALLNGLNAALASAGISLRYMPLTTSDQFVHVILAEPAPLRHLAAELSFPVGDAGTAAQLGQDFERAVIDKLERGS